MLRGVSAGLLLLAVGGAAQVPEAQAFKQERMVLRYLGSDDKSVTEKSFPAINGNQPADAIAGPQTPPTSCELAVYCDWIPITIERPPDDIDEYRVEISLFWDFQGGTNDLDIFFWDDRQITGGQEASPDPTQPGESHPGGYTLITYSTGAVMPEVMKISDVSLGNYNLVVYNASGPNFGYTIRARMFTSKFEDIPDETGDSDRPGDGGGGGEADIPAPKDYSDETVAPSDFGLPEGISLPDVPLTDVGFGSFSDSFQGGAGEVIEDPGFRRSASALKKAKAKPPSGFALGFWLAFLPVGAGSSAAFAMMRRSRVVRL